MSLQKLKSAFTNTWMNDVTYLSAMAHSGWGALIVVSTALFSAAFKVRLGITGGLVLYALVKEFAYDANFEVPKQSFWDNLEDFVEYLAGIALAWGLLWIKSLVGCGRRTSAVSKQVQDGHLRILVVIIAKDCANAIVGERQVAIDR